MAKFYGHIGKLSKSIGQTTFAVTHHGNIARAKKLPRYKAPAELARSNRARVFQLLVPVYQLFLQALVSGLSDKAKKLSIYAQFQALNVASFTGAYPSVSIDFNKLVVAHGALPGYINPIATWDDSFTRLNVAFQNNSDGKFAKSTDMCFAAVYNATNGRMVVVSGHSTRGDGSFAISASGVSPGAGDLIRFYAWFQSADGKRSSNQFYHSVTIAP